MARRYHSRNIHLEATTYERIREAARRLSIPASAWIRMAIRHEIDQENTKSEVSQLRDELAANFTRVLDQCRNLSNAQQAAIAILDTLTKYVLSVSPEPGADAQRTGRRRYEQFLKSVATALEGDVLHVLADLDGGNKGPNGR